MEGVQGPCGGDRNTEQCLQLGGEEQSELYHILDANTEMSEADDYDELVSYITECPALPHQASNITITVDAKQTDKFHTP